MSAFLNQFLISVGQGSLDNFSKDKFTKDRDLVWCMFLLVTIFTQVIILNMLIAIMADTFDRVIEN